MGHVKELGRCTPVAGGFRSLDELMALVADRDVVAFAELYGVMSARVFGVIRSVVRDTAKSEEVFQEVMLEIWRVASNCDTGRGTALGWTLSIAHRRAVDCVRREESRRSRDVRYFDARWRGGPGPFGSVADREASIDVRAALLRLPVDQREPIEMAFFSGLTHTEIAALLEVPLGTVKYRVRTGLGRLRTELEDRAA